MKILSNFNKAMVTALIMAILLNICPTKCMELPEKGFVRAMEEREMLKNAITDTAGYLFGGWIGLSVLSFTHSFFTKVIANKFLENNPIKKQQYLKYARYSYNGGCVAAIPVISLMAAVSAEAWKCFDNGRAFEAASGITRVLIKPCGIMTYGPATLYVNCKYKLKPNNAQKRE